MRPEMCSLFVMVDMEVSKPVPVPVPRVPGRVGECSPYIIELNCLSRFPSTTDDERPQSLSISSSISKSHWSLSCV